MATIKDIATKRAFPLQPYPGCSITTQGFQWSGKTCKRIFEVAEEMNYKTLRNATMHSKGPVSRRPLLTGTLIR